jgi:hypothetical protein
LLLSPIAAADAIPSVCAELMPPLIRGTASLAHRAYEDHGLDDLLRVIGHVAGTPAEHAGLTLDRSMAHALRFRRHEAERLQRQALAQCQVFRVLPAFAPRSDRPLRLLALMAPGDLMVNTPLDFITAHLDVRLDLLFVVPGQPLPARMPDHDVAFFAVSESDPASLRRLRGLYAAWPRPVLNDPAAVARLARDTVAAGLASVPGLCSPPTVRVPRDALLSHLHGRASVPLLDAPALIRPVGSHGGRDLARIGGANDLAAYLDATTATAFFVSRFVDYRDANGMYRKLRVVMIDGAPFLCHMAISPHWMVHYLNAGMAENPARRAEEARAMAAFDTGFAVRHAEAFAALNGWIGLDYFQLDCAETPDGRLVVFEADVAAIIHLMDPSELFPYKAPQMRRVFAAFEAMLRRRAEGVDPLSDP